MTTKLELIDEYIQRINDFPVILGDKSNNYTFTADSIGRMYIKKQNEILFTSEDEDAVLDFVKATWKRIKPF